MKRIVEQDYYDLLEVSPTASSREIQRAYEQAKETFDSESLAVYSLFSEKEVKEIQAAIEKAYQVLIDEESRKQYDQSHPQPIEGKEPEKPPVSLEGPKEKKSYLPFTEVSVEVGEGPYRGTVLKQIREKIGIDLRTLSSETKINTKIIEWIEEENYERLPALVYLKGFLKGYAQSLGLAPQKVIGDYLQFMNGGEGK